MYESQAYAFVGVLSLVQSLAQEDWHRTALHVVRLAQPLAILLLVLASLASPIVRARRYRSVADVDTDADATATPPSPTSAAPQPVAVMVPVRSRRRILTQFMTLALAATYFVSGALIVARAVISPRTWTPNLARWESSDMAALLGLLAWFAVAFACALEQRQRGAYGRGKVLGALLIGATTDAALLVLFSQSAGPKLPKLGYWSAAQLALPLTRLAILYPICALACSDSTRFVRAADLHANAAARLEEQRAAAGRSAPSQSESSTLLNADSTAPTAGTSYGATTNGTNTPKPGTQTPANNSNAANGTTTHDAAGLSVNAAPQPPTFRVFAHRLKVLFPYLWPRDSPALQALAGLCVVLLVAGRLVNLAVPITLGAIVDDLTQGTTPWWHLGLYASLKALQGSGGLLTVLQSFFWIRVEQYSDRALSIMAFERILDLSMAFHTRRKTGEILRILDRGAVISSFFQYLLFQVVPIFVDISVAMVFLGRRFGWAVGLTLGILMYCYTVVSIKMTTWRTGLRREANNLDAVSRGIHADSIMQWETVKSFSAESYEVARYRRSLQNYQNAAYKVTASLSVLNLTQNLIITAGMLVSSLLVASAVVRGDASPSDFTVFIVYLAQVMVPLNWLGTLYRTLQQNLTDTDRLMDLLGEESDVKDAPGAPELVVTEGIIEFRDVWFAYPKTSINALSGVSFTINPKSSCALIGESGAGKSSIMRLLYRFYDVTGGAIFIDGQDISKVSQQSLRKAIGIVPQEPSLFNTNIRDNILYGDFDASDEEIEAAARAAQIWDRIQGFPDGLQTTVGERGVRLSGGEKQRVALARVFLKNSKILLLDEATSALDTTTEKQLQQALSTLMNGRTSLTIAHRLSTVVDSDKLIVLANGRVVEQGSHAELVEKGGAYAAMWSAQIQTAQAEAAGKEVDASDDLPTSPISPGLLGIVPPSIAGGLPAALSPTSPNGLTLPKPALDASSAPSNGADAASSEAPQPSEAASITPALSVVTDSTSSKTASPQPTSTSTPVAFPAASETAPSAPASAYATAPASTYATAISEAADSVRGAPSSISASGGGGGGESPSIRKRIASMIRRTPSGSIAPASEASGDRSRKNSEVLTAQQQRSRKNSEVVAPKASASTPAVATGRKGASEATQGAEEGENEMETNEEAGPSNGAEAASSAAAKKKQRNRKRNKPKPKA